MSSHVSRKQNSTTNSCIDFVSRLDYSSWLLRFLKLTSEHRTAFYHYPNESHASCPFHHASFKAGHYNIDKQSRVQRARAALKLDCTVLQRKKNITYWPKTETSSTPACDKKGLHYRDAAIAGAGASTETGLLSFELRRRGEGVEAA